MLLFVYQIESCAECRHIDDNEPAIKCICRRYVPPLFINSTTRHFFLLITSYRWTFVFVVVLFATETNSMAFANDIRTNYVRIPYDFDSFSIVRAYWCLSIYLPLRLIEIWQIEKSSASAYHWGRLTSLVRIFSVRWCRWSCHSSL